MGAGRRAGREGGEQHSHASTPAGKKSPGSPFLALAGMLCCPAAHL